MVRRFLEYGNNAIVYTKLNDGSALRVSVDMEQT